MLKISKYKTVWLSLSAVFFLTGVVFLMVWGLKPGVDFIGGTLGEYRFESPILTDEIRSAIAPIIGEPTIQLVDERTVIIKTRPLSGEEADAVKTSLEQNIGAYEELRFESIGPTIGAELRQKAYWQVILVLIGIILYIAYAFRRIKKISQDIKISSWKLGFATIAALAHDLVITLGFFALLGHMRGVEIDTLFVTALLTILGFSVHDTIVVFDRVREYIQKYKYKSLEDIVDFSVNSTLARSINTTSTLLFVLVALLFFGGSTIYYFVLALLVGVIAGTYSSIFLASPLLIIKKKK